MLSSLASVVWHLSLPLMNTFNKTETAIFPCRLCFLRAFPFISLPECIQVVVMYGLGTTFLFTVGVNKDTYCSGLVLAMVSGFFKHRSIP